MRVGMIQQKRETCKREPRVVTVTCKHTGCSVRELAGAPIVLPEVSYLPYMVEGLIVEHLSQYRICKLSACSYRL